MITYLLLSALREVTRRFIPNFPSFLIHLVILNELILIGCVDCGMIPPRDQVIIINCEDANGSGHTAGSKPRLSYTLAERKVLQVIYRDFSPAILCQRCIYFLQEPTGREEAPIGTTAAIEDIILDIENDVSVIFMYVLSFCVIYSLLSNRSLLI